MRPPRRQLNAALAVVALAGCGGVGGPPRPAIVALSQEGMIRQRSQADCGIAALLMILRQRGIQAERGTLARDAGLAETGVSLGGLRRALVRQGLSARPWRLTPRDLARAPKPAIAWFGGNHFVVVDRIAPDGRVTVRDPAIGRFELSAPTFAKQWRGETLVVGRFVPT